MILLHIHEHSRAHTHIKIYKMYHTVCYYY